MKQIRLSMLIILFISCATRKLENPEGTSLHPMSLRDSNVIKQRELLRGYALCSCIQEGYKKDSAVQNDISASWYLNMLLYKDSILQLVRSNAREYASLILPSQYPDYKGKRAVLFLCTQYVNTSSMDSLLKSFDTTLEGNGQSFFGDD